MKEVTARDSMSAIPPSSSSQSSGRPNTRRARWRTRSHA